MTVINIKTGDPYDVYIGNAMGWSYGLKKSKWHNPFKIGRDGNREEVIRKYREYSLNRPELLSDLHELEGKILGCWCKPESCHGDVLIELIINREG